MRSARWLLLSLPSGSGRIPLAVGGPWVRICLPHILVQGFRSSPQPKPRSGHFPGPNARLPELPDSKEPSPEPGLPASLPSRGPGEPLPPSSPDSRMVNTKQGPKEHIKPGLGGGEAEEPGGQGKKERDQELQSWEAPPLRSTFIGKENDAHFAQSYITACRKGWDKLLAF